MTAQLIDGTAVARQVREDVAKGVAELVAAGGAPPGLATVLIGDDRPQDPGQVLAQKRVPAFMLRAALAYGAGATVAFALN